MQYMHQEKNKIVEPRIQDQQTFFLIIIIPFRKEFLFTNNLFPLFSTCCTILKTSFLRKQDDIFSVERSVDPSVKNCKHMTSIEQFLWKIHCGNSLCSSRIFCFASYIRYFWTFHLFDSSTLPTNMFLKFHQYTYEVSRMNRFHILQQLLSSLVVDISCLQK